MRQSLDEEEEWEDVTVPIATRVHQENKIESSAVTQTPSKRERSSEPGASPVVEQAEHESRPPKGASPSSLTGNKDAVLPEEKAPKTSLAGSGSSPRPGPASPRYSASGATPDVQTLYQEAERLSKTVYERDQQIRDQRKRIRELERALEEEHSRAEALSKKLLEHEERIREEEARSQAQQVHRLQLEEQRRQCEQEHVHRSALHTLEATLKERDERHQVEQQALTKRLTSKAQAQLEELKNEYMDKLRVLQAQLHHMRDVIERTRNDAEQRELYLREELVQARNRIAELEQQNQELSGGVSEATRPLLRQIQLLQVQIRERRETEVSTKEQIERQLVQAEAAVAEANEARARLAEEITRLRARVHELESATHSFISECEGLRKEKAAAEEALSEFRARCAQLEDVATKASAEWTRKLTALETDADRKQKAFECALEGLQRERDEARQQLEQRERELSRIGDLLGASASATASVSPAPIQSPANECANMVEAREESMSSGAAANEPAMAHEESLLTSPFPNPILWTQMQSLLRRRANQMRTLQAELTEREASIANLTQEISMLTERLDADAIHRRQLEERIGQMEEREQALLELLGEREERLQELNNDIADMKGIYREQLQELVDQLEEARTATQTSTLSRP